MIFPYNLPPWMCMKEPYMFMSFLIPGPKGAGNDIDAYLRPLINELNELWENGVNTYDVSTRINFQLKAKYPYVGERYAYSPENVPDKKQPQSLEPRKSSGGHKPNPKVRLPMTTNKERIERIEADLGSLQDKMEQMEVGINDKLQRLEESINKLVESNSATKGTTSCNSIENSGSTKPVREEREAGRHMPPTQITKLEFPRFADNDPTE
ncbi:hypothetical protein WN944_026710 [Citrus x changshan-huyou]|uniref:Transposase n=1 Tax=Citrus x changshan-huyou TaxID=2935761 RepID=A0AAP0LT08_9ROSI